jgi:hypothetical protein
VNELAQQNGSAMEPAIIYLEMKAGKCVEVQELLTLAIVSKHANKLRFN